MSNLPTYLEHVSRSFPERRRENLSYDVRLVKAMGKSITSGSVFTELSWTAFNYVKAQSRLAVIVARVPEATKQEIDAQAADITAWQNRASRIIGNKNGLAAFYGELVSTMTRMALDAQRMDDEEKQFMELGVSGRIGEVVVRPVEHTYTYDAY